MADLTLAFKNYASRHNIKAGGTKTMNKLNGSGHFWVRKKFSEEKVLIFFTESLAKEDKVNFVKFVFGFEKTPLDGFKYVGIIFLMNCRNNLNKYFQFRSLNPTFSIIKTEGQDSLPKSSTWYVSM